MAFAAPSLFFRLRPSLVPFLQRTSSFSSAPRSSGSSTGTPTEDKRKEDDLPLNLFDQHFFGEYLERPKTAEVPPVANPIEPHPHSQDTRKEKEKEKREGQEEHLQEDLNFIDQQYFHKIK